MERSLEEAGFQKQDQIFYGFISALKSSGILRYLLGDLQKSIEQ